MARGRSSASAGISRKRRILLLRSLTLPARRRRRCRPASSSSTAGLPFRHGSDVINVLVTADGKTILTQGYATVRLWDVATGRDQGALELPDDSAEFWTGSLSPDGKTLITTRRNGTAQEWDLATRKMTRSFRLAAPPFEVTGAKCVHSPDGKAIAVVTNDGSVRVCDVTTGKEMEQLRSHSDEVTAAAFTADGKILILASKEGDGLLLAWDVATGKELARRGAIKNAENLLVLYDGTQVLEALVRPAANQPASKDATMWIVPNVGPDAPYLFRPIGGNSDAYRLMAVSPDGKYLFAPDRLTGGRILTQWDLHTRRAIRQFAGDGGPIHAMAFTADGKTLITADTGLRFWDWKTGQEKRPTPQSPWPWHAYALSPDGTTIAESDGGGIIRLWNAFTGQDLRRFEVPRPTPGLSAWLNDVAISPDGTLLAAKGCLMSADAAAPSDRRWYVWVWDMATGQLRRRLDDQSQEGGWDAGANIVPGPRATYGTVEFSGDGRTLVSTKAGRPPAAWDVDTGREQTDLPLQGLGGSRIAISASGSTVGGLRNHGIDVVDVFTRPTTNRADGDGRGDARGRRLLGGWSQHAISPTSNVGSEAMDSSLSRRTCSTSRSPAGAEATVW